MTLFIGSNIGQKGNLRFLKNVAHVRVNFCGLTEEGRGRNGGGRDTRAAAGPREHCRVVYDQQHRLGEPGWAQA